MNIIFLVYLFVAFGLVIFGGKLGSKLGMVLVVLAVITGALTALLKIW